MLEIKWGVVLVGVLLLFVTFVIFTFIDKKYNSFIERVIKMPVMLFLFLALMFFHYSFYYVEKEKVIVHSQELVVAPSSLGMHEIVLVQSSNNYIGWVEKNGGKQKFPMSSKSIVFDDKNIEIPVYLKKCIIRKYLMHEVILDEDCHYEIHTPKGSVKMN